MVVTFLSGNVAGPKRNGQLFANLMHLFPYISMSSLILGQNIWNEEQERK